MDYNEFLRNKIAIAQESGFTVELSEINSILKPHQKDAVRWAIRGGCRAIFASFGLGKTVMQLEILRLILQKEGGKALIVTPLNIVDEFFSDAENLLHNLPIQYVKNQEDIDNSTASILITNYERVRDGNIKVNTFTACSLDEASVLRSYGSKTYQEFLPKFRGEIVYDPFAGLFTVPYIAVKKGRYGIGHELNEISFNDGIAYLKEADMQKNAPTLFDLDDFKIAK